jgi:hypothetical protein
MKAPDSSEREYLQSVRASAGAETSIYDVDLRLLATFTMEARLRQPIADPRPYLPAELWPAPDEA